MPYNTEEKKLTIDLSKASYDAKILLQHKDVTFIRIDECIEQFELPIALKYYKALAELQISGKNRDTLYPPPLHLEKLTHIKTLSLWSYCDIKKLTPLPHIETLRIEIKDPFADMQTVATIFPNLKKLEIIIWKKHQKSNAFPPEIGNFKNLECLEMFFSLIELPVEFKKLERLKSLTMRTVGSPMTTFPKILCEMNNLEELVFTGKHITTLPDNFSNLKALKTLDFSQSFNEGTFSPVNSENDSVAHLHPIPEVIGTLSSLRELSLNNCGVTSLAFLEPLKKLKKLQIGHSVLTDCNELMSFYNLEELNLESAMLLTDIRGLSGLPIKNLNLEYCDNLKSIAPVKELRALEELNIKDCEGIKDLEAIKQHSSLKVLTVSEDLKKKWMLKEQFKNMPSLNIVTGGLTSEEAVIIQKTMKKFGLDSGKNNQQGNIEKPADTTDAKKKFIEAGYNKLKAALSEINEEVKPDIYALSFWYFEDEDDLRFPSILISYNTNAHYKEQTSKASSDKEAKWNFAFWPQDFIAQIGGEEDELLNNWFKNTPYFYSEEENEKAYENEQTFENILKQGGGFCDEFIEETMLMTRRLFNEGLVKSTFGKNIPIIIHEMEYYNDTLYWTLESNPGKIADDFAEWVKGLGEVG